MTDILSMDIAELKGLMTDLNAPSYRAVQIFEWLHRRGAESFEEMDNLPKALRAALSERCTIASCRLAKTVSSDDGTQKFLYELSDGVLIESVLMKYSFGHSICISTQAGCRMGCRFCASGAQGLVRNLTAGEMCAQIYQPIAKCDQLDHATPNIVLMGCGEPLDNFEATIRFLELIGHPKGAGVGARHITVSTCGLVPQIRTLADMRLQINLAVSLHGPTDSVRRDLLPIAKRYSIGELMEACRYYIEMTNRRITFEYALVRGVNDSPGHAADLRELLTGILCHVNLIPVNPGAESRFLPTLRKEAEVFADILRRGRVTATVRRTIGEDIKAACGQLVSIASYQ